MTENFDWSLHFKISYLAIAFPLIRGRYPCVVVERKDI